MDAKQINQVTAAQHKINWDSRLEVRLALSLALMAFIASSIIAFAAYSVARNQLRQSVREHLRDAVAIAASQIDGDLHATLQSQNSEGNIIYTDIRQALQDIARVNPDFGDVYTLRQSPDGNIVFVVDSNLNPSHLGEINASAGPTLKANISSLSAPVVEEDFYPGKAGLRLSAYAPIFKANGQKESILGIDISAESTLVRERTLLFVTLFTYIVAVPLLAWAGWEIGKRLAQPIAELTDNAQRLASGDLSYLMPVSGQGEAAMLAITLNLMTDRLRKMVAELEQRVRDRTAELARRTNYLEAAAGVGQAASSILESDQLIREVVEQIRQRFGLYYVGLFLLDEAGEWAVLRAGTGEAGKAMLDRGHRIKVGSGMIGWCIANGQARVAMLAGMDAVRITNPELPLTRSEAAVPLRSRGQVIGALTVQSIQENAFDEQSLTVLQSMADLVAVALDNARLFAQSQETLESFRRAYTDVSRKAWTEMLRVQPDLGYRYDERGLTRLKATAKPGQAAISSETAAEGAELPVLRRPIVVRGQALGTIEARKPAGTGEWRPEEISLIETLLQQLDVALESARLYQETQRRAERERLAGEITAKLRASNDPQAILQTAVQELRQALQASRANVAIVEKGQPDPRPVEVATSKPYQAVPGEAPQSPGQSSS